MVNNWVLQEDDRNGYLSALDYDDYGYGELHSVSIGDEIEADAGDYPQYGIVIGIIRNRIGDPVCYKVWRIEQGDGCFDYIEASKVTLCEPCGSSEWSLGRIGYKLIDSEEGCRFINQSTGDVILW